MTNRASKSLKLSLCQPEKIKRLSKHADVDESLKGQGIGKQLVAKVVEKMRQKTKNYPIMSICETRI